MKKLPMDTFHERTANGVLAPKYRFFIIGETSAKHKSIGNVLI